MKSLFITSSGQTQKLSAWARQLGIGKTTILQRIRRGWPVERALDSKIQLTVENTYFHRGGRNCRTCRKDRHAADERNRRARLRCQRLALKT